MKHALNVYHFYKNYIETNGYAPLMKECAAALGVTVNVVNKALTLLAKYGYIRRTGRWCGIEIVERKRTA